MDGRPPYSSEQLARAHVGRPKHGVVQREIGGLNKTPTALRGTKGALRVARGSLRKHAQKLAWAPGEGRRRGAAGVRP